MLRLDTWPFQRLRLQLRKLRTTASKALNVAIVLSMALPNLTVFAASTADVEAQFDAPENLATTPIQEAPSINSVDTEQVKSIRTHSEKEDLDNAFGAAIKLEPQNGFDFTTLIYGNTDGTYYYPVAAYLTPGYEWGFHWDNPGNVVDFGDGALLRGYYTDPGSSVFFLTLDFGGLITSPGGDWMFSKTGTLDDASSGHYPWWAGRRVWYSQDYIGWPEQPWPGGDPPLSYQYFGSWPSAVTGDGTTTWTPSNADGNSIPAGAKFRYLRLRLQEGRGIAPVEGWEGYNEVELFMDSFRVLAADFETVIPWWAMIAGYGDACLSPSDNQETGGGPINTLTGGYDFNVDDLSLSSLAGPLKFNRTYSSLTTDEYTTSLGYGWTHNLDTRLIFNDGTTEPLASVHFKAHSANQYEFIQQRDGSYISYPGVCAELSREQGPPITYTVVDQGQNRYVFDEDGNLMNFETNLGRSLTYSYDGLGRLSQVSDEGGRYLSLSYDAGDRITNVSDHTGRHVSYAYDAAGDLGTVIDVLGQTWTYIYDSEHRLTEVLDPRGLTVERTEYGISIPDAINFYDYTVTPYDGDSGSSMSIEDGGTTLRIAGNAWKKIDFPIDVKENTILEFDYRSGVQAEVQGIAFDNDNNMSAGYTFKLYGTQEWGINTYDNYEFDAPEWKHYVIPVGQHYTGSMQYIGFVNDHDVSDPTGESYFSNILVYESEVRAIRQYNGEDELVVELIYNPDGTTTVFDALGNHETHVYDDRNTIISQSDSLGGTSDKTYDPNFRPATLTDEDGDTTQLTWSEDGDNLTQVIDAEGNTIDLTYDALNNLTSVIDPLGAQTDYAYDGTLLTSSTDDLDNITSYTYTPEGFLESVTDARGATTSYTYDTYGQRTSMTDALGNTWLYRYDDLGQLIESEGPTGAITRNEYDDAGRLVRVTRNYDPALSQSEDDEFNIVTEYVYDEVGNQVEVIDTYGNSTQYAYDDANRLIRTTDPAGNETTNTYDNAGQLVATTDALERTYTYDYDELNRLVETTDPLGNSTTTAYNPDGTVASTSDALGHTTTYTYDDLKRVVATTDPMGNSTSTTYDETGNVVATTDALNRTTTFDYDALGRLIRQTDPLDGETQNFFDAVGNRVQTIDPKDHATTYAYDELNRLESVTDALGNETAYAYDAVGNRTSVTDANDHTTSYSYDGLDRLVIVDDPLGHASLTTYDALGNVIEREDPMGNFTSFAYDVLNRLTHQTDAMDGETAYTYDAVGNQLTVTDANDHTTTTSYDDLNRPVSVTDPLGHTTTTTYDAAGNVIVTTDSLGNSTAFDYDNLDRQISITDPMGNTTSYAYDDVGNRTSMTDANGIVTRYEYDDLNRLTAVVENYDPGDDADHETNVRTEYTYDAVGNRLTIRDGNGHVSTFSYDAVNRLESEVDPLGHGVHYTYDGVGNRIQLSDAEEIPTYFQYDAANRLIKINYPHPDPDVTFSYDAAGNRISMTDGVGTTHWSYDELSRPDLVADPFGDLVEYEYDAIGNRTALLYPDGKVATYVYDAANRMTQVTDWDGQITSYAYDAANRITTTSLPNGVTSTYTYDDASRLLDITHATATEPLSSFTYTYDAVGNRTRVEEFYLTPGGGPTVTVTVTNGGGGPMQDVPVYVFDGATYTGYHKTTDENGEASITLPEGNYRFRVDVDGTQFWSGDENHCAIPGCTGVLMTIPDPVLVVVQDTGGAPMEGLPVYVFDGSTYTGRNGATDANGEVPLRLVEGEYRFRADLNGTQFWSDDVNHCSVPGCTLANVTVTIPVAITVEDSLGMPQEGLPVYAFSGGSYTGYHGTSDENGQVSLTLPVGDYRFRADSGGTQFWSGETDHCTIPGCLDATVVVTVPVTVNVEDTNGDPKEGVPVYAFDGATNTGFHGSTDGSGEVQLTLPEGSYRFRADYNGTQFWSGEANHCAVPGCASATVVVTLPVTVTVEDTDGAPKESVPVYVFDGTTYTNFNGTTNIDGEVVFTLPQGDYRFRADHNGTQFWSGETNHCTIPGCESASITVTLPVTVTVEDSNGTPKESLQVYVFNGTTYTGYNGTTDIDGEVAFTLPMGDYRFRADLNGTQFWSDTQNHCAIPGCESASVVVTIPVIVTVEDWGGAPQEGVPVYVFDGTIYTGYNGTTDVDGEVGFTLPMGGYRFRADDNGEQYWSGDQNHCTVPGCESATVVVGSSPTTTPTETPTPNDTPTSTPTPTQTATSTPTPTPTPTATSTPTSTQSASLGGFKVLALLRYPPINQPLAQSETITVTVEDTNGAPQGGLPVYAFDGSAYTGYHDTTDADGEVSLTLPDGSYRFRADKDGTQFWSGEANHCTVPGCESASITVTLPVVVTVEDTDGVPREGLPVYAFDGTAYTSYNGTTDIDGEVAFTLPVGEYRFRSDLNPQSGTGGTQFWSGEINHCTVPGCEGATVVVTLPVTVYVENTDAVPQEGLPVYVFDGATYTGFHGSTDANGEVQLTLPQGDCRFRSDLNGAQFWSGETNHCTIPGCLNASITVTIPMTVTVQSQTGSPYPDLSVYAFSGESYTGFHGTSDGDGQVAFTLPAGSYRFRADYTHSGTGDGVQFWSDDVDHCTIPGCLEALVEIPGGVGEVSVTIDYEYDPLYRLTEADYSTGEYFWYTYDAVGNRLTQETHEISNAYTYDIANRLIDVDGMTLSWDNNGNLLSDGVSTYTYNHANWLIEVLGVDTYAFSYNGLGDRLSQTVIGNTTNYTLDIVSGLTQVLSDGENAYLYGLTRIGEEQPAGWAYHLPDALGSVRQLTDSNAVVTLAQSFEPFGSVMTSSGAGETSYTFTGEWADGTGLVHLRARYYVPANGRFLSRDKWNGNSNIPMSFNAWLYVYGNPVNYSDESGNMVRPWPPEPPLPGLAELLGDAWQCNGIRDPEARRICIESICSTSPVIQECPPGYRELDNRYNLSGYYCPLESDFLGKIVRVRASNVTQDFYSYDEAPGPVYLGTKMACEACWRAKRCQTQDNCFVKESWCGGMALEECILKANEEFLYKWEYVCCQGMGKLEDGRYIACEAPSWEGMASPPKRDSFGFEWLENYSKYRAYKTAAICKSGDIPLGSTLYIPDLMPLLRENNIFVSGVFTVNDTGEKLCTNPLYTIDIYTGEGKRAKEIAKDICNFNDSLVCIR